MDTMEFERRCWAEVDLGALRHNFKLVRERAGDAAVMAVVKADAYGHGDAVVAPLLEQEGADQFAVSGFGEAVCLRRAGVTKPILILGYTGVQNAAALAVGGISQTVFSLEYARALSGRGTVSLHGRPARVLGRVCMDQIVVDVTDIPDVKAGDAAIVFGGGAADSVDDVARMTGTINYEVLCDVGRRVQRVYVENGAEVELVDYLKGE